MSNIVYLYQYNKLVNGHSIFDTRLITALSNIFGDKFSAVSFDIDTKKFKEGIRLKEIDTPGTTIIFSHFNTFRAAVQFKKSKIIFINHDLPYHAYFLNKSIKSIIKGIYILLYIKYYWQFSNYNLFISAAEHKLVAANNKNTAHIKVGIKPGKKAVSFQSIAPVAVFTGNYKWSLKKKSLYNTFKNGYTGNLKLIAVNTDVIFDDSAKQFSIPVVKDSADAYAAEIKIGIITDHFLSGFKLKALELISMGCCIASFTDIIDEFKDAPFADLFIRKIANLNKIDEYYDSLLNERDIYIKFQSFYDHIAAEFNWDVTAGKIAGIVENL